MKTIKRINLVMATIAAMGIATTASAMPIVGAAVDNFTDQNSVGSTEYRSALGGEAIKYFIPLEGSDCTYGVAGCGTSSDYGNGGPVLSMNLMFSSLQQAASTLYVNFEDLDLEDANDPYGFFESVQVFNENGDAITGLITNIADASVSGNADTQQLMSLNLGVLMDTMYFATLNFSAEYYRNGRNTPEYLIATIEQTTVPEPTVAGLLAIGLMGIGAARKRKRIIV